MPPSPGSRVLSSSTVSAEGTKNRSMPSAHKVRLEGPIWAAIDSQRNEMIAATLMSTRSSAPRLRRRCGESLPAPALLTAAASVGWRWLMKRLERQFRQPVYLGDAVVKLRGD